MTNNIEATGPAKIAAIVAAVEDALSLTANERVMLQAIVDCEYHDGSDPVGHYVWSASVVDGCVRAAPGPRKTWSGVASSLAKKGLARSSNDGDDDIISITAAGMDAIKAADAH